MKRLYWKDPEPIEGNDYIITMINREDATQPEVVEKYEKLIEKDDDPDNIILIHYGGGSEAEVLIKEIAVVEVEYTVWATIEKRIDWLDGYEDYEDLEYTTTSLYRTDSLDDAQEYLNRNDLL